MAASAWSPVTASMRRTPDATPLSATILNRADIADPPDVGAAAQFGGKIAHAQHPHPVAVFLAEQRHGASGHRFVRGHERVSPGVGANLGVDQALDRLQLFRGHRFKMGEVEAQPGGIDQRAFLRHMVSENLAQGGVHQVGRRVLQRGGVTLRGVHLGFEHHRRRRSRPLHRADMR